MEPGWDQLVRRNPPVIESERRASSLDIVEINFRESEARQQAARCLRCNINTIFDTSTCIACNGCVDVCPENLIRLVGLDKLRYDEKLLGIAADSAGLTVDDLVDYTDEELRGLGAIMLKDESTCIRCAMCASRCPTQAITMKKFEFYRECVTIDAVNPKLRI